MYDYFIKDHLGNTRVVLTEQTDFSQYLATMEQPNAQTEEALFYNLDNTREARPLDYPQDNITTPNTAVARLNGSDPDKRVGPSIILRVMAGDTIQAAVRAYYRQQANSRNNAGVPAEQMAISLMQALSMPVPVEAATHEANAAARLTTPQTGITSNDLRDLKEKDPQTKREDKPKAYLNYVFFDNQFKFVYESSGVKQVDGEPGQLETLASGKVVARKSGYIYVYTSNESQQDVLFDNMSVTQASGPILEETHYYPYGLVMDGISTSVPLKLANNYKYNGKELNHGEFSDGTGLDWYSYGMREYDVQIGRFPQLDPLTDEFAALTPYQYASNEPIGNIDMDGMEGVGAIGGLASQVAETSVWLSQMVVTAAKPVTTSAKLVKGAGLAGKIGGIASAALHGAQVAGTAVNGAFSTLGSGAARIYNDFNHAPFWKTGVGQAIDNTSTWINHNVNPLYLAFNGINSQFTGQDYLSGSKMSHAEGAAQLLTLIPAGKLAEFSLLAEGIVERTILGETEAVVAKTSSKILSWGSNAKGHLIKHADALGFEGYSVQQLQKMLSQLRSAANQLYNDVNPALTRIGRWGGQADDVLMHITNNGKMLVTKQNGEFITVINKTSNNWYQLAKPLR